MRRKMREMIAVQEELGNPASLKQIFQDYCWEIDGLKSYELEQRFYAYAQSLFDQQQRMFNCTN